MSGFFIDNVLIKNEYHTLRQRQNGCHFGDDTLKLIFLYENSCILFPISLKFVPKDPIDYNLVLVQIMAWHQPGDKLLSQLMMVRLLAHICFTQPQWVQLFVYIQKYHVVMIYHSLLTCDKWCIVSLTWWGWDKMATILHWDNIFKCIFTPQPLRAPGYCRTPSGRVAGQTSPVNTLTSIIFHGSFSNLARTFITLRSWTSSIMEVLPH